MERPNDPQAATEAVPGLQIRIGSGAPGGGRLHNSDDQPDERFLEQGVQALSRLALDLLS